jgi:hypothetical protein
MDNPAVRESGGATAAMRLISRQGPMRTRLGGLAPTRGFGRGRASVDSGARERRLSMVSGGLYGIRQFRSCLTYFALKNSGGR